VEFDAGCRKRTNGGDRFSKLASVSPDTFSDGESRFQCGDSRKPHTPEPGLKPEAEQLNQLELNS
jgi:hypothetical protein